MWKTLKALVWARLEPSREERINVAEKLLEGTGFHVHGNPTPKVKPLPLLVDFSGGEK